MVCQELFEDKLRSEQMNIESSNATESSSSIKLSKNSPKTAGFFINIFQSTSVLKERYGDQVIERYRHITAIKNVSIGLS